MAQFGHLASGAAWSTAGKAIQLALSLLALAVIARLVGPHVYGIFALGWLVVGLFEVVVSSAPTDTLIQRDRLSPGHLNATFWATLALGLLIAGGIWAGADLADHWLDGGALLAAILPARAAVLPLQALAVVPTAILLRESRFKAVAGAETLASIASNLAGVGLALAGTGIWSLVGMELVRVAVLGIALYGLTRWRPGMAMRPSHLRDLLAFNASTWCSWGLGYLSSQLPRFVLAASIGAQAVGYYALAQRLFEQVKNIVMIPAYQVVQAGVARSQHDVGTTRRLTDGTLRITGVVACPLFLGIAALAPVLVPAVFGDAWHDAVAVVQIIMLLGVLAAMSVVQAAVIRGMGKPHWEIVYELAVLAATALFLVVSLPWGLNGAAAAVVLGSLVTAPVNARFVRELTGLGIAAQLGAIFNAGLASLVMAAGVWGVAVLLAPAVPAALLLPLLVAIGAVLYWTLLKWTMPAAARVMQDVVLAVVRRDLAAVRASFAGLAG